MTVILSSFELDTVTSIFLYCGTLLPSPLTFTQPGCPSDLLRPPLFRRSFGVKWGWILVWVLQVWGIIIT